MMNVCTSVEAVVLDLCRTRMMELLTSFSRKTDKTDCQPIEAVADAEEKVQKTL